jgi:acetolactate synthase-1/2/3 large subunit
MSFNKTNTNLYTGADIVVKTLHESLDVKEVFGYPGGAILPIYDALFRYGSITHHLTRHEQAAGHAAEGYARSSGKVGVLFATSGPGATNTVTAIANAFMDSTPLVVITGQVPSTLLGTDAFQEADVIGITRPCTKANYLVTKVQDLEKTILEAFFVAKFQRPGPVLIDIPKDVQNASVQFLGLPYTPRNSIVNKITTYEDYKQKNLSTLVDRAIEILKNSSKPIIYSGGGLVSNFKAIELLEKFVELTNFPITSTLMGLGVINTRHKNYLKMLGMHGSVEANMAMYNCDAMLAIGVRFDDRVTGNTSKFSPNSKKIHIDIDNSAFNKTISVDISIKCDACEFLELLLEKWTRLKINTRSLDGWWTSSSSLLPISRRSHR